MDVVCTDYNLLRGKRLYGYIVYMVFTIDFVGANRQFTVWPLLSHVVQRNIGIAPPFCRSGTTRSQKSLQHFRDLLLLLLDTVQFILQFVQFCTCYRFKQIFFQGARGGDLILVGDDAGRRWLERNTLAGWNSRQRRRDVRHPRQRFVPMMIIGDNRRICEELGSRLP